MNTSESILDRYLNNPAKQVILAKMPTLKHVGELDELDKRMADRSQAHCWLMNDDPEYRAEVESKIF